MPTDQITTYYFTQGVLGVTVLVLGIVLYFQDKRHRVDIKELNLVVATLQEKRNAETNIYADKFITTSTNLLNQMKDLLNIGLGNQKAIETIANILQSLKKTI